MKAERKGWAAGEDACDLPDDLVLHVVARAKGDEKWRRFTVLGDVNIVWWAAEQKGRDDA